MQLLGLSSAGLAFAGCQRAGEEQPKGEFLAAYPYDAPPKGHFNLLEGVTSAITMGYIFDLIMIPGAMYYWSDKKYEHMLAAPSSKVSDDGKTLEYTVRSGLKWSDGSPITGQDVYDTWLCRTVLAAPAAKYLDHFELTDDMTVTFHIAQPAPLVEYYLLRGRTMPSSLYGELAKEAEPLVKDGVPPTDDVMTKLSSKIAAFRPKEALASGAFNFDYDKVGNGQLRLVRNKNGYRANKVAWDSMVVNNGQVIEVTPLILGNNVDYATYAFPIATDKQFQKNGLTVMRPPTYFGYALYMNFGKHPEFRDKRFRHALAQAIKRDQAGRLALGDSGKAVQLMAGISDLQVPDWMTQADQDKLNRYPFDLDAAATLLAEAGWTQRQDTWYTPEGKQATYDITIANNPDWVDIAGSISDDLDTFGIKLTTRVEAVEQQPLDIDAGKVSFALQTWGNPSNPFPTDAYAVAFLNRNYPAVAPDRGIDFPLRQQTEVVGEIDLEKAVPASGIGASREDLQAAISKVALAFNELLPILPLVERLGNTPVRADALDGMPPEDDPLYLNSIYADNPITFLMYSGQLKPA